MTRKTAIIAEAMLVGTRSSQAFDSSVGVVIELMIIWAAFRWILSRRKQHGNRP